MAFGRLARRADPAPMSEINVTPLVDVMLVLLVIFILTAPLLTSAIRLDLPTAEGAQSGQAPRAVSLVLDGQGRLYFNDQPIELAALAEQLRRLGRDAPDTEIQLRADQARSYGQVLQLMGVAQAAGLSHIGLVAQAPR